MAERNSEGQFSALIELRSQPIFCNPPGFVVLKLSGRVYDSDFEIEGTDFQRSFIAGERPSGDDK